MTIFHVLKYQISIPPTEEEIYALPDPIFNKWLALTPIGGGTVSTTVFKLSYYFKSEHEQHKGAVEDSIRLLRKLIEDYKE